jgi:glycosyltransferase involved in cell wall biosynthesis
MVILLYLANPIIGGWVSFTSHLSLLLNVPIYRISNKTNSNANKHFGYGTYYNDITLDNLLTLNKTIIITAVDRCNVEYLNKLKNKRCNLIINSIHQIYKNDHENYLYKYIKYFKIITIRNTIKTWILKNQILSKDNILFINPPYMRIAPKMTQDDIKYKSGCVCISRIDYSKKIDIILKANKLLLTPIKLYGIRNKNYCENVLKPLELDNLKDRQPNSNYYGKFQKSFITLNKILNNCKFVIDLSTIDNDGDGLLYTFMEAIDFNCALILHDDWVNTRPGIFKPGINCLSVKNEYEIVDILESELDTTSIIKNAKQLINIYSEINNWKTLVN